MEIEHHNEGRLSGYGLLAVNTARVPVSFVDIDTKTGEVIDIVKVKKATAWAEIPTPGI